jgi:hypothetical protein
LTPTPACGLPWATAALGLLLLGCPAGDDSMASATTPTTTEDPTDSESESETQEPTTTESMTSDATMVMTSTETGTPDTSDDTGPPLEGPGCGIQPVCDKGELAGSASIESSADIAMIEGYTSMTGWLEIFNSDLVCLDFLACLESVGHDITIFGNPDLRDFRGFNALTATGTFDGTDGFISIGEHASLTDINGFAGIERIKESLSISENPVLESVSGFENLVVIERDINITFNAALTDLNGLSGLAALGNECVITNNENLCTSEVQTVCGDLQQPPASEGPPPGNTANNKDC